MQVHRAILAAGLFAGAIAVPASATTGIYVQTSATGAGGGLHSVIVTYGPTGLVVQETDPADGTTSSYSPISAPAGQTAITLAAAVSGSSSGAGTATADLANGIVRAAARSGGSPLNGYRSRGYGYAELYDDLSFSVAGGGSGQIAVMAHLDGTIGAFATSFSTSALSYILNFGGSNLVFSSLGTQAGFDFSAHGGLGGLPDGWDSFTLSNLTETGFDFTGLLTVSDGETRSVRQRLSLACQEGVDCDFSHTGSVALQLPAGVGFTSGSGVFLSPPAAGAVPEPASWAMMIAGFGLAGAAARRRRATVPA